MVNKLSVKKKIQSDKKPDLPCNHLPLNLSSALRFSLAIFSSLKCQLCFNNKNTDSFHFVKNMETLNIAVTTISGKEKNLYSWLQRNVTSIQLFHSLRIEKLKKPFFFSSSENSPNDLKSLAFTWSFDQINPTDSFKKWSRISIYKSESPLKSKTRQLTWL